jgi:proteasome beta subunit
MDERQPDSLPVARGTTTLGLTCKEGVVLATERRATGDTMILSHSAVKLFALDKHLGLTIAGYVGDAQALVRYFQAEIALYRLRRGSPLPVEGAATLISNLLNQNRYFPYLVGLVLGGVDRSGNHVYGIDMDGGMIEDRYVSEGSGSPVAYGVLESGYSSGLPLSDGVDLALRALTMAMRRDSASGDGYLLATIGSDGFRSLSEEDVKRRLGRLKLP